MATLNSPATTFPREPANFNEVSMHQSMLFSDSLKDLKNLRKQLHSAAEYFELSYSNDEQKDIVVDTLKEYAIKALVNTVDHLGSVTYEVSDLLDEKFEEVSGTELRISCIELRLKTCQEYIDNEGLSQQSLCIHTPKYHKQYILPAVQATIGEITPSTAGKGFSPSPSPRLLQQYGKFSVSGTAPRKELDKRTVSPHRFPLLRTASLASRPTTPKSSRPTTPKKSRPTTPNPSNGRRYAAEPHKSASMWLHVDNINTKDPEQHPSKSKRLLKSLLSRRKSKKDETLYTYIDKY